MAEVESLGGAGKVDESMAELARAEALKTEKQEKERELQQLTENSGASGHQKLRVCDICGAYLSILDSDRRLADHFGGKVRSSALNHVCMMVIRRTAHRCISATSPYVQPSMNGAQRHATRTEQSNSNLLQVRMAKQPSSKNQRAIWLHRRLLVRQMEGGESTRITMRLETGTSSVKDMIEGRSCIVVKCTISFMEFLAGQRHAWLLVGLLPMQSESHADCLAVFTGVLETASFPAASVMKHGCSVPQLSTKRRPGSLSKKGAAAAVDSCLFLSWTVLP